MGTLRFWGTFYAALLACFVLLGATGCPTKEQDARLVELEKDLGEATEDAKSGWAHLQALLGTYATVKEKIDAVLKAIAEKRVPAEEGAELVRALNEEKGTVEKAVDAARTDFDSAVARGKEIEAEIAKLKAEGVPGWLIALRLGLEGIGLLAPPVVALYARRAKKALTLFGATSRALDAAGGEKAGDAMAAEIRATDGLTEDVVRPFHHAATAGEI